MAIADLSMEKATAHYDQESKIAHITYRGVLTAEESTAVYEWLGTLIEAVGIDGVYGEIFDFREVTEFEPDNLMQARRNSRRHNLRNDGRRLPVAMIVSSFVQEEILRGPMQNVEQNTRKTIVWKEEDALAFLKQWNEAQVEDDTDDSSDDTQSDD